MNMNTHRTAFLCVVVTVVGAGGLPGADKAMESRRAGPPLPVLPAASVKPEDVDGKKFDLVVVGGTPGGIACAVRAAREGLSVLLVNHTRHLGGFVTSGAGGWEAPYDGLRSPLYAEIRQGATDYYREQYGADSLQCRASIPNPNTNAHIDRAKVEPRIAEMLFNRMVAREKNLTVLTNFYVTAAERDGASLKAVALREMDGTRTCRAIAKIFADGMYEADLVAAAKVPYRVGRESSRQYNEPHAGVLFTQERHKARGQHGFPKDADEGRLKIRYNSHATAERVIAEESGSADNSVMAYNYRLILTKDPANRVPVPAPADDLRGEIRGTAGHGMVPNLPNNKVAWNSGGRLIGPQNDYPEADWPTREKISRMYLNAALGQLWRAQNDPGVDPKEREFWKDYGLAKDEFPDNHHVPYEIYVREARRLVGRYVFTEHDGVPAPGLARTPIHPDSVAITDWPIDSVACLPRKAQKSNLDGIFFLAEESRPAQVPYRCLLPQGIDNLLVPVALSASHVGWGCIRLEPVWMQTGEAAGFAAALALKHGTTPAGLDPDLLVRTLVNYRAAVSFFNDADSMSEEPWVSAVQYLGTKGFFASYDAQPTQPLTATVAACWTETFVKLRTGGNLDATAQAHALAQRQTADDKRVSVAEFVTQLEEGLRRALSKELPADAAAKSLGLERKNPISRGGACRLVFALLGADQSEK